MKHDHILIRGAFAACGMNFFIRPSIESALCFGLVISVFAVMNRWSRTDLKIADEVAMLRVSYQSMCRLSGEQAAHLTELTDEISKINDRLGPMQLAMNMRNR